MLDVILITKPTKFGKTFDANRLKAGILYNKSGVALNKILFYEENGMAKEVWNDETYSFDCDSKYYLSDVVDIGILFYENFKTTTLSYRQLLMGYKMFLNDTYYLSEHVDDFGMFKREIGYSYKEGYGSFEHYADKKRQELFNSLLKIINYQELNKLTYEEIKNISKKGK